MSDPAAPTPTGSGPPWFRSRVMRRYVIVVAALLVVNWLVAGALYGGPERATIAYSPLFLDQVNAGNVAEIGSTDTGTIQGTFRKPVKVPGASQPVSDFETQVPSFADDNALSADLAKGKVTVNASPPDNGPGLLESLLVGFGPVLLLIAAFVWISRRAGSLMGGGPLGAFTRARARRVEARRRTPPSPTSPGSTTPRTSWPRSSTTCAGRSGTAGSAAASRAGCSSRERRGPARRCWRAQWRARRACRSSRCRPRSSWR